MANKVTQDGQCQPGTADLASVESAFDCLSTGMSVTVVFVFVVVFLSALSAVAASSVIPLGSISAATSSGGQSAAPEVTMKCESPEVSEDPGPLASSGPPPVLPGSRQNVVVPGEVLSVGGLPDSMQLGVNSGEVPPGNNVASLVQVGVGHGEVPPVGGAPVGAEPVRATPGGRRKPPQG